MSIALSRKQTSTSPMFMKTARGAIVRCKILPAVFPLEILHTETDDAIVEVFSTKVGITCSRLDFESPSSTMRRTSKEPPPISQMSTFL